MSIRSSVGAGIAVALACAVVGAPASAAPTVKVRDACDPATFDAVLGAGACVDGGNVTFDSFIDRLIRTGDHPLWRFTPERATVPAGQSITVSNVGGEFHTFSRTVEFGGGFVEELNELLGLEEIADGCTQPPGATNLFLGAGESGTISTAALGSGTHRFLCCVHPWMRATYRVQ
jgi:plastocyanin